MKRASAHVAAALILSSVGFVLSTTGALAKDNPGNHYGKEGNPGHHYGQLDNPGNHYGQLKHTPPPPAASPPPQPVAHSPAPGATPPVVVQASVPGLTDGGASSLPDLPVTLPSHDQASSRSAVGGAAPVGVEWLILLVLPLLTAVWAIACARIATTATRRRRAARAALVGAPSAT